MNSVSLRAKAAVLLLLSGSVAACTLALNAGVEDQCITNDDCAGRGASFAGTTCTPQHVCTRLTTADAGDEDAGPVDPIWGCVGKSQPVKIEDKAPIRFQWKFVGALSEYPMADIDFKICTGLDVGCTSPIGGGKTNADGVADMQLYKGFRGYLELSSPSIQKALFYFPPPKDDTPVGPPETYAHLLTVPEFGYLLGQLDTTPDPEQGHIFGLAFDCGGILPAAGVTMEASRVGTDSTRYYTDDNRTPTLTQLSTSWRGEAGYLNLPPGATTLNYFRGAQQLGSVTVAVRPGFITFAPMVPQ